MDLQRHIISILIASMASIAMVPILAKLSPPPGYDSQEIDFIIVQIADRPFLRVAFGTGAIAGAIIACPIRMAIKRVFVISFFNTVLATGLLMTSPRVNYDPKNDLLLSTTCRLFLGVGVGGLSATIPSYVGEIAKSKSRGKLSTLFQVGVVTGMSSTYIFGLFQPEPLSIGHLFNIVCYYWVTSHTLFILRFMLTSSKVDNLQHRENDYHDDPSLLDWNEEIIQSNLKDLIRETITCRHYHQRLPYLLFSRPNRRALVIGIGLMFFHQICSVNVIIVYMCHILKSTAIKQTAVVIVGILQIVMTSVSMTVIDNVGRCKLLISSAVIMCISSAGLYGCLLVSYIEIIPDIIINIVSMIFIGICISAYYVGFGPVPWVVIGEIFSPEVKSYGMSFATATNWAMVIIFSYTTNEIICSFIGSFLIVHCIACLLSAIFVFHLVPETKKISLAKIQEKIAGSQTVYTTVTFEKMYV